MHTHTHYIGVQYYYDQDTQSAIGYLTKDSGDGWTKAGTWFTFNDKSSIKALTKYISKYNITIICISKCKTILILFHIKRIKS